jgi:uracil-DNA glycosylase family 4
MKPITSELKDIVRTIKRYLETEELSQARSLSGWEGIEFGITGGGESLPRERPPATSLEAIKKEVLVCTKCDLCKMRTRAVFGSGDRKAPLMFIGEAPGMEEDLQGLPFVGRAGKLLTKIIESIGLKRSDVYITNVVKCRPPNNRNPLPTEILTCEAYLATQITLIRPKVICALGKFAAQTLLRSQESITRLRGRFQDYHGAKLMPTFHPAYLLRNPNDKHLVWEDMKKIRKELSRHG